MTYMDKLLLVCEAVDNRIVADCYMESGLNMAAVKKKVSAAIQKILEALKQFMQKAKVSFGVAKAKAILKSKFFRQNVTIRWQISDKEIRAAMKQINASALKVTTGVRKVHDQVMNGKMDPEVGYAKLNDLMDTWTMQTTEQVNRAIVKLNAQDAGGANVGGATQAVKVVNILRDITDLATSYTEDCYKVVQKHVMQLRKEAADLEKAKELEEKARIEYAKLNRVGKLKYKSKQSLLNFKNKCASTLSNICRNAVAKIQRTAQIKKLISTLKAKISSAVGRKKVVTESASDTINWADDDVDLFLESPEDGNLDDMLEDFTEGTNIDLRRDFKKANTTYKAAIDRAKSALKAGDKDECIKYATIAKNTIDKFSNEVSFADDNALEICCGFILSDLIQAIKRLAIALPGGLLSAATITIGFSSGSLAVAGAMGVLSGLISSLTALGLTIGVAIPYWIKLAVGIYKSIKTRGMSFEIFNLTRDVILGGCHIMSGSANALIERAQASGNMESVEDKLGDAIDALYEETCHTTAPAYDYKYEDLFEESVEDTPEEDSSYYKDELAELIAAI